MTHHLSCDLETFSKVPIKDAGAYRYIADPSFEILLFAYSLDGAPVEIIDLASGEHVPDWLIRALYDPSFIKHAYNAPFEIGCLSKYYGRLDPSQWRDTMIHGLYAGYTAGLDATGKALGLPADKQKLATGKALIRYFCVPCKPTKSNGGRTRNYPKHDPEKWELFKEYCRQDVVTEMEIDRRLATCPVPEFVQKQWETDLRINSRGAAVDLPFVEGALDIADRVKTQLMDEACRISGLSNPNSVAQLMSWINDRTGRGLTDLRKDTVARILDDGDDPVDPKTYRMLQIRQELGKTSTKKYNAIETCVCPDGRVRGLLQFYGANRTGRYCLTGDHEVLTETGWCRLDQWSGGSILCWNSTTESLSFQKSRALCFDYDGEMITYTGQRIEQIATPEHKMAVLGKDGRWEPKEVKDITGRFTIPFTGKRLPKSNGMSDELRVLIMTQADGHYADNGIVKYHFAKQRKVERCKRLLRRVGIPFVENHWENGVSGVTVQSQHVPLWLRQFKDKTFGYWLLDEDLTVLFDEISEWDGYRCGPNSIQYCSTNEKNVDVVQACAICAGLSATKVKKVRDNKNWSDAYYLSIWLKPGRGTSIRKEQVGSVHHNGKVYCAETSTGYFVVRRKGKVWITGNSGRLIQVQNLPRTYTDPIELARELVTAHDADALQCVYGSVNDTLSQLIRTAFVASPGNVLIDADFSAIEARVISWLAGEQWRLEVFRTHGKIYEASASQMFGVPIEMIKKGNPEYALRAKGKVAELALGYQGGPGALIAMGALDMGLTEEELPEIVQRWRASNKRIQALWWAMDEAARNVIENGGAVNVRGLIVAREYDAMQGTSLLTITLPSKRKLYYVNPQLCTNRFGGESMSYTGIDQTTKQWKSIETYGGKLTENCVQAIARDCLCEAIERLEAAGFPIVFHVHDEVVIDIKPYANDDKMLQDVCDIMRKPPVWAPDLPLNAAGWVGDFFTKD